MKSTLSHLAALACASVSLHAATSGDQPNILVIVSDDHGYEDVGFQGCKDIPTPHLDRLAAEGVHCTNGYVSHPFCSPSRAGLLTGRYQHRFGHERNPFYNPQDHREGLPMTEHLLPEFLAKAGYTTGWVGKWHLGAAPEFWPQNRGFAETFGFIGGGHKYINWTVNPKVEYTVPIERNGKPVEVTEHLTTAFGNEAAAFVKRHADSPWFLYLAFNAPHTPHEPTPERLERFASITDKTRRAYAAQVSLLDDAIGVALEALRESGQDANTLVFFFSDNGGPIHVNGSSNDPLRDGKGSAYEGGVRVPFVVKWPAKLAAGTQYDLPVSALDVFATSLAVAGAEMPSDRTYDSVNLLPHLFGEQSAPPHDLLFWRSGPTHGVRGGDWKLVSTGPDVHELYQLRADIGEENDLSTANTDQLNRLKTVFTEWEQGTIPPAFPGAPGRKGKKKAKEKNP